MVVVAVVVLEFEEEHCRWFEQIIIIVGLWRKREDSS